MSRPLDDATIVEQASSGCPAGVRLAIALAGRLAADLGATVIRIEPAEGDPMRRMPPLVSGHSAVFAFLNAGKQSVVRDDGQVSPPEEIRADATLTDGVAAPGAGPVQAPVRVEVSMLGSSAPAGTPASEFTVLALGGVLNLVGDPDREPLRLGGHQAAYAGGLSAFTGLMGALCTDGPEVVQVSLLETAVWLNWKNIASAAVGGDVPSRAGRHADWPIVRCADGWVALVYQDRDWPTLVELLGRDARLADPALRQLAARSAHAAEIAAVAEEHLGRLTRHQIREVALARRLPLGPVWQPLELREDAHDLARGFLARMPLGDGVSAVMPTLPALWDGRRFLPRGASAAGPGSTQPAEVPA